MKRVLLIAYDWPPAGGPNIQRNVKFCKYLPRFGWEPIVLTVRGGEYLATDNSFGVEIPDCVRVVRTPVLEPHKWYKRLTGMKRDEPLPQGALTEDAVGWKKRFAFWIHANLFLPDPRIGWLPFALRRARDLFRSGGFDLVMSSGPPHTTHLIARRVARWSGVPWVADFRDPWTKVYYLTGSSRTTCAHHWDKHLERIVLRDADRVIAVTKGMIEDDFRAKVPSDSKYIQITNGFDEADFRNYYRSVKPDPSICRIVYTGMVSDAQIPVNLLHTIRKLADRKLISPDRFSLSFVGNTTKALRRKTEICGAGDFVHFIPYVPHREVFEYIASASILLLLIANRKDNKHVHAAKLFEYLRSGKPILALGPRGGEAEEILRGLNRGWMFDYGDLDGLERFLAAFLKPRPGPEFRTSASIKDVMQFSREVLTGRLVEVFDSLVSEIGADDGG